MSLTAVNQHIQNALADGHLSTAEAKLILSKEDKAFKKPLSIGSFVGKDEYQAVSSLHSRIQSGEISASAEAKGAMQTFIDNGPDSRAKHALKGGPIGKKLMGIGAATGGSLLGAFGAIMGLGLQGWKLMVIAGPVWALGGALLGTGVAYGAGVVHGLIDD